jgi:hypothetical protein
MQEAYRKSSYYEGGACGYADTSYVAQEPALRATFRWEPARDLLDFDGGLHLR